MHGHLVTVEVRVECGTCEGVELDGLALYQLGLECLDTETVKGRGSVEQDGVSLHYVLEDVPDDGLLLVHDLLGRADCLDDASLDELADDEGLVQLGGHVLGQTALVHVQLGSYDDHRTGRVVHTFTEQVLTEAALLSFEGVRKGLEGAVGVSLDGVGLARVVEEGVNGFLEHTFLVAEDDFGGLDLYELLQTVVADDDAAVEVIEVGCGETSSVQGHERPQVGGNDGDDLHDHPLGTVHVLGLAESLDDAQTLEGLGLALLGCLALGLVAQVVGEFVQIEVGQEGVDGLCAHSGDELLGVAVIQGLVVLGQTVEHVQVLILGEERQIAYIKIFGSSGLDDDVPFVIDDGLELLRGNAEEASDLVGCGTEVPDVGYGDGEGDVTHPFPADLLLCHLYAAAVADDAAVADSLVFSAVALVVLGRTEYPLAEEAVALGLVCTVVDGLGLEDLTG